MASNFSTPTGKNVAKSSPGVAPGQKTETSFPGHNSKPPAPGQKSEAKMVNQRDLGVAPGQWCSVKSLGDGGLKGRTATGDAATGNPSPSAPGQWSTFVEGVVTQYNDGSGAFD